MMQLWLFVSPLVPKAKDQPLVCAFDTPWEDHFRPPIGNGKGCQACDTFQGDEPRKRVRRAGTRPRHSKQEDPASTVPAGEREAAHGVIR